VPCRSGKATSNCSCAGTLGDLCSMLAQTEVIFGRPRTLFIRYSEWSTGLRLGQLGPPTTCHTRFLKDKTECITICMPGSSSIHIVTSSVNNQQQYHEKRFKRL
jgi:hypothetical protein